MNSYCIFDAGKYPVDEVFSIRQTLFMETTTINRLNAEDLEQKVKKMYREVALNPAGDYHFEMGRTLAEKLGYDRR